MEEWLSESGWHQCGPRIVVWMSGLFHIDPATGIPYSYHAELYSTVVLPQ